MSHQDSVLSIGETIAREMIYKYSTQRRSTDVENKKKVRIERPALGGKINKESPSVSRDQSMIMDEHE